MTSEDQSHEGTVQLADGRPLGHREYGEPAGAPVVYLHGMPGSRLEPVPLEAELRRSGVRLVALERPGYGLSTPRGKSGLLDWPADVAAAADQLGIGRFAVLGVSTGGKYAAACAYALPERVGRAAIVSGIGPPDDPAFPGGAGQDRSTDDDPRPGAPVRWRSATGASRAGWLSTGHRAFSHCSKGNCRYPTGRCTGIPRSEGPHSTPSARHSEAAQRVWSKTR